MKNKTSRQRNAALLITSIVILAILNVASYFIEIAVNKIFINLSLDEVNDLFKIILDMKKV